MKRILFVLVLGFASVSIFSQDVTTVEALSSDISDNLDLNAVASIFGESEDLADFEMKLNDPNLQISNLDLNGDGEVDYLRVVETSEQSTHLIAIQAVIGEGQYQDVATIEVEKDNNGESTVQVVGDVYMYGPDYIIQPVYVQRPVIVTYFYTPYYNPYYSPYYWGYYPPYYDPWNPYSPYVYRSNVYVHVNVNNSYPRTSSRRSTNAVNMQRQIKRNDYAKSNPNNSFQNRNEGVRNTQELENKRGYKPRNANSGTQVQQGTRSPDQQGQPSQANPNTRPVNKDWKPTSERENVVNPNNRQNINPSSKPVNSNREIQSGKQSQQPVSKPTQNTRPTNNQVTQPANQQNTRPATQPAAKPATNQQVQPAAKPTSNQQVQPAAKPTSNQQNAKPTGSQPAVKQTTTPAAKPDQKPVTSPTPQRKTATSPKKGGG